MRGHNPLKLHFLLRPSEYSVLLFFRLSLAFPFNVSPSMEVHPVPDIPSMCSQASFCHIYTIEKRTQDGPAGLPFTRHTTRDLLKFALFVMIKD